MVFATSFFKDQPLLKSQGPFRAETEAELGLSRSGRAAYCLLFGAQCREHSCSQQGDLCFTPSVYAAVEALLAELAPSFSPTDFVRHLRFLFQRQVALQSWSGAFSGAFFDLHSPSFSELHSPSCSEDDPHSLVACEKAAAFPRFWHLVYYTNVAHKKLCGTLSAKLFQWDLRDLPGDHPAVLAGPRKDPDGLGGHGERSHSPKLFSQEVQ